MVAATILVVDDERNILTSVSRALGLEGYDVEVAADPTPIDESLGNQHHCTISRLIRSADSMPR